LDIMYEPCGQRGIDDAAFTSIFRVIAANFHGFYVDLPRSLHVRFQRAGKRPGWGESNGFLSFLRSPSLPLRTMSTTSQYYSADGVLMACAWRCPSIRADELSLALYYLGLAIFHLVSCLFVAYEMATLIYKAIMSILSKILIKFRSFLEI
jgi:hypothetical protein